MMPGFPKISLQLQILLINSLGIVTSTLTWLKWSQHLKKTWRLSVSQLDEPTYMNDIGWIRTIVSQIDVARSIINRVSLFACLANVYTILTRNRQNLLILWMVLNFVKDIALEVVVIVTTFLLWFEGSVSTSLLVKFIVEKMIWLVFSTWKWYTTFQWYMHLRKVTKIRKIMLSPPPRNIVGNSIPGRAGHSLDDECLGVATRRRGEFVNSLDEFPEETSSDMIFDLQTSKILTTLATSNSRESNDTNDYDSIPNDLSVDEKSMKLLNITAEDVMDARARKQERSYWSEQNSIGRMFDSAKDEDTNLSLAKNMEKMTEKEKRDTSENGQIAMSNTEEITYRTLKRKDVKYPPIEEEDNNESVSVHRTKDVNDIRKKALNVSSTKDANVTRNKAEDHTRPMESRDFHAASEEKTERAAQEVAKIIRCPSSEEETSTIKIKSNPHLAKENEVKLNFVPVSHKDRQAIEVEDQKHVHGVRTKISSAISSNANAKGYCKRSEMSSYARRYAPCVSQANVNAERNGERVQPVNINDEHIRRNVDGEKFRLFIPKVVARKNTPSGQSYALRHLARCSGKLTQTFQGSLRKPPIAWNSMSLAQTARPSGYSKKFMTNKSRDRKGDTEKIPNGDLNGSKDSLKARRELKYVGRVQHRQTIDPRTLYDTAFDKKRSVSIEHETSNVRALSALLADEKRMKTRTRYDLPPSRKLSIEEREAMELKALRAYNERTLLEDKKKLEENRKYNSSLSHERSTRGPEITEVRAPRAYKDLVFPEDRAEIEALVKDDLPINCEPIEEPSTLSDYNKFTFSYEKELAVGRGRDSTREEDVEPPTNISDRSPEEVETAIHSSEMSPNQNSVSDSNDHGVNLAHTSLNLREITRNIEWTLHPRGIILTNKNLQSQLPERGRSRESQQRDIVDSITASALHNAFFFRPEIVTRIFQRVQTRYGESLPNFQSLWREDFNVDFNVEFVWRVNDETNTHDRASTLDFAFEQSTGENGNDLEGLLPFNIEGRTTDEEDNHIYIIFLDREEVPSDSETTIAEVSSATEPQVNIGSTRTTNTLLFNENHYRMNSNATNDNLPIDLFVDMLRNLDIEEFLGNTAFADNDMFRAFNVNDVIYGGRNNNRDKIPSSQIVRLDDSTDDRTEGISSWSNSLDQVDAVSFVNSSECDNRRSSQGEEHSSNIGSGKICKSNLFLGNDNNDAMSRSSNTDDNKNNKDNQFDKITNTIEKSICDRSLHNLSKKLFPSSSSFNESPNRHVILKSRYGESQKLTRPSNDLVVPDIKGRGSISSLRTDNDDKNSQLQRTTKVFRSQSRTRSCARSEDEGGNAFEGENETSTCKSRINSDEKLPADNSFDSTYERNDSSETPISLEEGSLMEEFSHDIIPPEISSDVSATSSSHAR